MRNKIFVLSFNPRTERQNMKQTADNIILLTAASTKAFFHVGQIDYIASTFFQREKRTFKDCRMITSQEEMRSMGAHKIHIWQFPPQKKSVRCESCEMVMKMRLW